MGKQPKAKKVPNKHLHSRVSFLYQAASALTLLKANANSISSSAVDQSTLKDETLDTNQSEDIEKTSEKHDHVTPEKVPSFGLSQMLVSHLRSVSRKGQVRLSPRMKRTMCKRCNSLLIPGKSSSSRMENKSRGGKKPWADVLVIECLNCGACKRFPTGAERQPKKTDRLSSASNHAKKEDPNEASPM
jgi:ribonuclease P protein subunit RPR2